MKVLEAIKSGSKLLKEKNVHTHILDSELLLSKSLNKSRVAEWPKFAKDPSLTSVMKRLV